MISLIPHMKSDSAVAEGWLRSLPALEFQRPSSEWWVRVENRAGKVGWSMRTEDFGNRDRCE